MHLWKKNLGGEDRAGLELRITVYRGREHQPRHGGQSLDPPSDRVLVHWRERSALIVPDLQASIPVPQKEINKNTTIGSSKNYTMAKSVDYTLKGDKMFRLSCRCHHNLE